MIQYQKRAMKLVLLPGLDGTGKLFTPLLKELDSDIDVQIVSYSSSKKQTYEELVEYVINTLPKEDFILLAESFSGFIAYQIGLKKFKNLKHIIVVATFLKTPRAMLLKFFPSTLISLLPLPKFVIKKYLLGDDIESETLKLFESSIRDLSSEVLRFRINEIKSLSVSDQKLTIPTTYIQAENDKLVLKNSLDEWKDICDDLTVYKVAGSHLVLQSNPKECADVIKACFQRIVRYHD